MERTKFYAITSIILLAALSGCTNQSDSQNNSFAREQVLGAAIDSGNVSSCGNIDANSGAGFVDRFSCFSYFHLVNESSDACIDSAYSDSLNGMVPPLDAYGLCALAASDWVYKVDNCEKFLGNCGSYSSLSLVPSMHYDFYDTILEKQGVVIVVPDELSAQSRFEVDIIKASLEKFYYLKEGSSMKEIKQSEVYCDDTGFGSKLAGKTVIVIGDQSSNRATGCLRWFPSEHISFKRNVWGDGINGKSYAIVVRPSDSDGEPRDVFELLVLLNEPEELAE